MKILQTFCFLFVYVISLYSEEVKLQLVSEQPYLQEIEMTVEFQDPFLDNIKLETQATYVLQLRSLDYFYTEKSYANLKFKALLETYQSNFWIGEKHVKGIEWDKDLDLSLVDLKIPEESNPTVYTNFSCDEIKDSYHFNFCDFKLNPLVSQMIHFNLYRPLFLLRNQNFNTGDEYRFLLNDYWVVFDLDLNDIVEEMGDYDEDDIQFICTFKILDITPEVIQFELIKEAFLENEFNETIFLPYSGKAVGSWNCHNALITNLEVIEEVPFKKYQFKVTSNPKSVHVRK